MRFNSQKANKPQQVMELQEKKKRKQRQKACSKADKEKEKWFLFTLDLKSYESDKILGKKKKKKKPAGKDLQSPAFFVNSLDFFNSLLCGS